VPLVAAFFVDLFAVVFLAADLAAGFFLAPVFLVPVFLVPVFLAAVFLAAVFLALVLPVRLALVPPLAATCAARASSNPIACSSVTSSGDMSFGSEAFSLPRLT